MKNIVSLFLAICFAVLGMNQGNVELTEAHAETLSAYTEEFIADTAGESGSDFETVEIESSAASTAVIDEEAAAEAVLETDTPAEEMVSVQRNETEAAKAACEPETQSDESTAESE